MAEEKVIKLGCGCLPLFGPMSVTSALGVAFIVLKVTHQINWSWLWVLAPFWAGYAIILAAILVFFGGLAGLMAMAGLADWWLKRRR